MNYYYEFLDWKRSSGWLESWERLLLVTGVSTTCAEATFRVLCIWHYCYQPGFRTLTWLPHRLSKRQSLTTVLLRTPITQIIFLNQDTYVTPGFTTFSYLSWIHWNRTLNFMGHIYGTIEVHSSRFCGGFVVYELNGLKEMERMGCCLWFLSSLCGTFVFFKDIVVKSIFFCIFFYPSPYNYFIRNNL